MINELVLGQLYSNGEIEFFICEVDDLDGALAAMQGAEVVSPVHATFYGSKEFTVKDPAGHIVTFAQFPAA